MNIIIGDATALFSYLVAIIVSIIVAWIIRLPILPEKPIRFSWTNSAVYPTPIVAIGLLALCFSVNFYWIRGGLILALILGVVSPFIVKYLFDYIFPEPPSSEDLSENGD